MAAAAKPPDPAPAAAPASPRPAGAPQSPPGPGFEGPEKKIEIDFRRRVGLSGGLLLVPDELWQVMLDLARCTIISKRVSKTCHMYLLSESSLFVYSRKIVLKTCGTTTMLRVLPHLQQLISSERNEVNRKLPSLLGLEVEYMSYSRKNFLYPDKQEMPHRSFQEEIQFLEKHFPSGVGYVLGPLNGEHWNFFVADYTLPADDALNPGDQTFEVIMSGLDADASQHFFKKEGIDGEQVTRMTAIDAILPGSEIDSFVFEPCGYSMNGLTQQECDSYWTIHVTPEKQCSFASFETNLSRESYEDIVKRVLDVFKPGQAVITLFADNKALGGRTSRHALPTEIDGYTLRHRTAYEFASPYNLTLLDLVRNKPNGSTAEDPTGKRRRCDVAANP
eukprot:TRINITY_DN4942_c1_g1_i1.p1 TRINITY_DN4942_c1_g1~~TRINITY_DN4942_c1_g1_i1.p1  ORF type:complete len:421 (+),score=156.82 TRINITY_DN4942_c1_g1_i1:93-1265(+)